MRKFYSFLIWIVVVVSALITVLVITQLNTVASINRLVSGNQQAAATFTINNRLEELVNLSFDLESRVLSGKNNASGEETASLQQSVGQLRDKTNALNAVLKDATVDSAAAPMFMYLNRQLSFSEQWLLKDRAKLSTDSVYHPHLSDSVYEQALTLQIKLEKTLSNTLEENNKVAYRVSFLNKILAFTALLAILILATIILRRQILQFILIRDLEHARTQAEQSARIKDQFLANMSHEIRTPLNALKGFSNLLSKTNLQEDQRQYSTLINQSSESLLQIVNDILDLSKIEAGAMQIKKESFELPAMIQQIEATYTVPAIDKKLELQVHIPENIPTRVMGDAERLKQVLVNLVSNAIKFTVSGKVILKIELLNQQDQQAKLLFEVTDTGIGIPADKQQLIFERFEQLDNSFVRQQGGTGLGLAITKTLVEAMGGQIQLQSELGKGASFSFSLNFQLPGVSTNSGNSIISQRRPVVTDRNKNRVLLVEDNIVNQLLISKMLEPYHIRLDMASNGEEFFKLMEMKAFDVVLMDVQMPVMDGISATKLLREKWGNSIPVIGMTAYVLPNEIEKCYAAGMNDYLAKPIIEDDFFNTLAAYVYLQPLQQELEFVTSTSETNIIDEAFLVKLCNGNDKTVALILQQLQVQLPTEIAAIRLAVEKNDFISLRSCLHHLRSTISPIGTNTLAAKSLEACSAICTDETDAGKIRPCIEKLAKDLESVLEQLKKGRRSN